VTVSLSSPQNGTTVSPGSTINWTISFTVSAGDNEGLALLVADLTQDAGNPATLDIPPAGSVPGAMSDYARPDGISNPAEAPAANGYLGTQRGTAGAENLVQIGGAVNTFGQARPPGSGVAENAVVTGGVGQSGSVTLASGSFAAPGTDGVYTYALANVIANVLTDVMAPPNFSPVESAAVAGGTSSFSFTVSAAGECTGDADGDNDVDLDDLLLVLGNFETGSGGDVDGDNDTDLDDLLLVLGNFDTTC
jgi:hypothetical protein